MNPLIDDSVIRAVVEGAPDCIILSGADGRIAYANSRITEIFGYLPEEVVGKPVELLVPMERRAAHLEHRAQYASAPSKRPMGVDLALFGLRRDGSQVPLEIGLSPVCVGNERFHLAFVRDATRLKRAENMAAETRGHSLAAELSQAALGGASLAELANDALVRLDDIMNAWGAEFLQVSPHDGRLGARAILTPEGSLGPTDYASGEFPAAEHCASSGTAGAVELGIRDLPGRLVAAGAGCALLVALLGAKGRHGVLCVYRPPGHGFTARESDMLETVAGVLVLAEERTRTEEQLVQVQKMDALGQLTGGVAHDFSNLLMVINGNLQLLEDELRDTPRLAGLVYSAADAGRRGAMLSRKLLSFARRQPLRPRPIDLNEHVNGLLDLLQRTIGENVKLQVVLDGTLPLITADVSQFDTSLMNLAINARDAMPSGGQLLIETKRVSLDADAAREQAIEPGDYVTVSFSDNGHGMTKEVAARVFEPFFTTKEGDKGSGLGLSMVFGFARQSGGAVRIQSTPGSGTTVRMYLPLPPVAANPQAVDVAPRVPRGTERVLVVEDEGPVLQIATTFLASLGYQVLQAADGEAAARLAAEHDRIDVLFADVVLPGIDGISLAHSIRDWHPHIAVLLTTGYASVGALASSESTQHQGVLQKPYSREDLAFAMRRAIDDRQAAAIAGDAPNYLVQDV